MKWQYNIAKIHDADRQRGSRPDEKVMVEWRVKIERTYTENENRITWRIGDGMISVNSKTC